MIRTLALSLTGLALSACATAFETPRNSVDLGQDGYTVTRSAMQPAYERRVTALARYSDEGRCADTDLPLAAPIAREIYPHHQETPPLSPGDMVRVRLLVGAGFDGRYIIAPDGHLNMPTLPGIPAAGFIPEQVETFLAGVLVEYGFFQAGFARAMIEVVQWAPVQVHVSGAVFQPGDTLINTSNLDTVQPARVEASGDVAEGRTLSVALSAAAGVRPDADIRHIVLTRQGQRRVYDMSPAFHGGPYQDPVLVAGDQIHVPSRGCFQASLARPSRITQPGIRVFMSNLTQPAYSNSLSAIGDYSTSLPYGTRLLQGLVSANCVGGIQATNANRWAVLISRNPVTGESEVIARSIEDLVRRADRDRYNPVLLPNDAIACYDSHVTNVRDIVRAFGEILSPAVNISLVRGALN